MKKSSFHKKVVVSIDLGGTDLKSGVVDSTGKILHQSVTPAESKKGKERVFRKILETVCRKTDWALKKNYPVVGVGLGVPGIVSRPQGVVHRSPHFPDWKDFPLRRRLAEFLKLPFALDNDANMAALGEGWRGAGKGKKSFVLITLGTGIGGGIVIDGKLHHGDAGFAGELGHLVIERNGRPCHCGGRGCLEMYASATGIGEELREGGQESGVRSQKGRLKNSSPEVLFRLGLRGNRRARKIYENFGSALGAGIASIANVLNIETFILGGGLSGAWRLFIGPVRRAIAQHTYPMTAKGIRIKRALLGNRAGLVGAARAVWELKKRPDFS